MALSMRNLFVCAAVCLVLHAPATAVANPLAFPRTRKDSCTAFNNKEKCEDEAPDNCIWATTVVGDYDQADWGCQEKSCDTISKGESGDPQLECTTFTGSKCAWHADVSYCTTETGLPPCELYYADPDRGEQCPARCVYNVNALECVEKGETLKCDMFFNEAGCGSQASCAWHDELYKCWESGSTVPCVEYEYFGQADCPDHCKFVVTGSDMQGNEEGTCLETDETMACEDYSNEVENGASCPTDKCKWYEPPISVCWSKTKELACERIGGETCAPEKRCKWVADEDDTEGIDGACEKCATNDCVSKYTGPKTPLDPNGGSDGKDTGLTCAKYVGDTAINCPEPRCFLSFDSGPASGGVCAGAEDGVCQDPVCTDLSYETDPCKAQKGCTYQDSTGVCYDATKDYPCNQLYEADNCKAQAADCEWKVLTKDSTDQEFCINKGAEIACSDYEGNTCPDGDGGTCSYNTMLSLCEPKDYQPPCVDYEQEGDCPSGRGCAWTNGVCWEQGKELACTAICTANQCESTGACHWTQSTLGHAGSCGKCDGDCPTLSACNTYTSDETCPEAECEFAFTEDTETGSDSAGVCVDKVCGNTYNKAECAGRKESGHICTWNLMLDACELDGFNLPCHKVYSQQDCNSAGMTCEWDAKEYSCNEKGYSTPCTSYLSDECPTDRCETEQPGFEGLCVIQKALLPTSPPDLTGKGDGKGNEDPAQCTVLMYNGIKGKLETADQECITHGRRHRRGPGGAATETQLECLSFFLGQDPNKATVAEACPCLWFYAQEVNPQMDHWMKIKC